MPFFTPLVLALAGALLAFWPQQVRGEVRRCVTPDEQVVFTDRKCGEIGAVERLPRHEANVGAKLHRGCARTLQDLVFEMTAAIDGRDPNRLAALYHWPGLSGSAGYGVLARLEAITNRPLVDIVPVMPSSPPPPQPAVGAVVSNGGWEELPPAPSLDTPPPADPDLHPHTAIRRDPVALRLEQTLANGSTPLRTVFDLTRHFGCWWVRF